MSSAVAITAIGFASSLGVGASQSFAAARAGMSGLSPLADVAVLDEESGEMLPVLGHLVAGGAAGGFQGVGRLVELTRLALVDLGGQPEDGDRGAPPLLIGVGGDYYGRHSLAAQLAEAEDGLPLPLEQIVDEESERFKEKVHRSLAKKVSSQLDFPIDVGGSKIVFGEQASVAKILSYAMSALDRNDAGAVIVGGVDTLVEESRIQQLAALDLIKTPVLDNGFFPGEAAAFVRLERLDRARSALATLDSVHVVHDPVHRLSSELPLGESLAGALKAALGPGGNGARPGLVLDSLNGDHWQSWDWGHAAARLGDALPAVPQWHPAEAFGEIGAATVPAMLCMAVRAFARGYAGTDRVLACVSGNDGTKAAAVIGSRA